MLLKELKEKTLQIKIIDLMLWANYVIYFFNIIALFMTPPAVPIFIGLTQLLLTVILPLNIAFIKLVKQRP